MAEARKPRTRADTLRVTTTVIDIEEVLDAIDHSRDQLLLPKHLGCALAHLTLQVVRLAIQVGARSRKRQRQRDVHPIEIGYVEREGVARLLMYEPERRQRPNCGHGDVGSSFNESGRVVDGLIRWIGSVWVSAVVSSALPWDTEPLRNELVAFLYARALDAAQSFDVSVR